MMAKKTQKKKKGLLSREISFGHVGFTQKVLFAKHLAVMLEGGLTISEALTVAEESATGKMKRVLKKVLGRVESGVSLSHALEDHKKTFSPLFIGAVHSGETAGTLEANLVHMAKQLEKEKELIGKVQSALAYPGVVLAASGALGLAMSYYVLPQITPLFRGLGVDLPLTTRLILWLSEVMALHGRVIILSSIFGSIFVVWLLRQKWMQPITHPLVLRIPILNSLIKRSNVTRFCLTLGTSLRSGLHIQEALRVSAQALGNRNYRKAIEQAVIRVEHGGRLSEELAEEPQLFPQLVPSMLSVGESSGRLDETALYLAEFYEQEVDTAIKTLSTIIEPLLLLGLGLVVSVVAMAIITPIYQITGNL